MLNLATIDGNPQDGHRGAVAEHNEPSLVSTQRLLPTNHSAVCLAADNKVLKGWPETAV